MKNVLNALFVLVVAIAFCIILIIAGMMTALSSNKFPDMTKEELILSLDENRSAFEEVADVLIENPDILEIARRNMFSITVDEKFYYKTKGKLYVKTIVELEESRIPRVFDNSTEFILLGLDYESIMRMDNCIYFIKGSHLAYASGIVFAADIKGPQYEHLIQLDQIEENWWYFKFR